MATKLVFVVVDISAQQQIESFVQKFSHLFEIIIIGPAAEDLLGSWSIYDLSKHRIIGITGIFNGIRQFLSQLDQTKRLIEFHQPDLVFFCDHSGFNIPLAAKLSSNNFLKISLIPAKTWAFANFREYFINKYFDAIVPLYDFEQAYFLKRNMASHFFGNPLIFNIRSKSEPRLDFVGFFPGSRTSEIKSSLKLLSHLATKNPKVHFSVSAIRIYKELYKTASTLPNVTICFGKHLDLIAQCRMAIINSGTTSFEAAILGTPQVVFYQSTWLNYALFRLFAKVPFIALPNLVLNKKAIPEMIQGRCSEKYISPYIQNEAWIPAQLSAVKSLKTEKYNLDFDQNLYDFTINLIKKH